MPAQVHTWFPCDCKNRSGLIVNAISEPSSGFIFVVEGHGLVGNFTLSLLWYVQPK